MKTLATLLVVLGTLTSGLCGLAQADEEAPLGWPSWMKVGIVVQLPQSEITAGASATNAVLVQDFNPFGKAGRAVVGHLSKDGMFTPFERDVDFRLIELGRLSAFRIQASGHLFSVAENLETLASTSLDRKTQHAIGQAALKVSNPEFMLRAPANPMIRASRVDSGPLGQINVAGRFLKLATPFVVGGNRFNVLKFSDYETYDRGRVTFGTLGSRGEFIRGNIPDETWRRRSERTYIGGIETPIFQIWDRETEIFQQLIGGRNDQKVVQSSKISVLEIDHRLERYTVSVIADSAAPRSLTDLVRRAIARENRRAETEPRPFFRAKSAPTAIWMDGPSSNGKTYGLARQAHMINVWQCENLFDPM